jgi:hypothetical protein
LCPQPSSLITAERSLPMGSGGRQSPASHRFPPSEEPGEAPRNPPRSGLLLRNPDSATQLFRHALHPDRVSRPRDALPQDGSHRTKGARHGVRETSADVGAISRRFGTCPGLHGEPSRSSGQRRHPEAASLVQIGRVFPCRDHSSSRSSSKLAPLSQMNITGVVVSLPETRMAWAFALCPTGRRSVAV